MADEEFARGLWQIVGRVREVNAEFRRQNAESRIPLIDSVAGEYGKSPDQNNRSAETS